MKDENKTKKQLIEELLELRRQNAVLKESTGFTPYALLRARLRLAQFAFSHSLEELLQATLDEVETITGGTVGFFHFLEEDQKTLSLQAWSTNTLLKMCSAQGRARHYGVAEAGVWVDCIRQRSPVIHNDYVSLKHRKGLPAGHAEIIRELVVPVFRGDRIVAIVGTGNKPAEYTSDDVESVSLLADLAWDLVESKRAVEALRRSEEKYRGVVENIGIGIAVLSPSMEILSLNDQMRKWFPHVDVLEKPLCYRVQNNPPRENVCSYCPIVLTLKDGQVHEAITETPAGDRTINYRLISSPIKDGDGRVAAVIKMVEDITERKEMEEALRNSELRLNEAQQIAHIGNWEWDIATNKVHWSDELFRIYGYIPGEISPDYAIVVDAMHPDSREEFLEAIDSALKGLKPLEMEYAFFRKDGSVAMLHTIGKVLWNVDGNAERMVGTVQDITEQKKAQEALRESEEKFRSIFDKANYGILIAEVGTRTFSMANETICEMLGYTEEEIVALGIEDIHPAEELPRVMAEFDKQVRLEKAVAESLPVRRKDGSIFYADVGTRPITLGGRQYAVGIFHDITGRLKMEEALRTSREFIKSILDTVDEAFVVIDRDYRIVLANSAYRGQANTPVEEFLGRHCYEISHGSDKPCYERGEECAVRVSFEEGKPHSCVHKHYDADGNTLYVETKSYPIKDEDGNVISAIEVINNITDRHLIEEQLLRTQKLEAVGLLAGGIAHDFNNLLMGIFGSISMAKALSDREDEPYQMLDLAEKALDQARNLTKQLLTFSKGGEPVKRVIHIPSLIRSSVEFALSGSVVSHVFSIDDNLWLVEADEGQIKQVIHNLIINAGEAMPEGGTVKIEASNIIAGGKNTLPLSPGKYVCIAITDTGMGISDSHLSRIFDPYFTTKQKGSGLGLTTSYSIIRKHGGTIDVKSQLGSGSTFIVYIPASEEKALPGMKENRRSFHGNGRILLMDDEEVVRTVAGYMLTSLGYEADFAEDGLKAIERYSEAMKTGKPFEAVILDLTVRGGMGGKDALRRLLEIDPCARTIVSSGYSEDSIMSNYEKYGFKAVLSKPYDKDELGMVLHSLLQKESS